MDLENFPTRQVAKDMMDMISPIYDNSYVAKWIFEVMALYLTLAQETVEGLLDEAFPETATWSLYLWEQLFGIETDESLSDEDRRAAILSKRNSRGPMNPYKIAMYVAELTGREVTVVENTAPHTYDVVIYPGDTTVVLDDVVELIEKIKQAQKHVNIVFNIPVGVAVTGSVLYKIFPYRMTAETHLAGRWPYVTTVGALAEGGIEIAADSVGTDFPYVLAGTVPDVSTVGSSNSGSLTADTETASATVVYKICGAETL